jgi:hypothetical protein
MLRRHCVALTLAILMMAALVQGAIAGPINAKNAFRTSVAAVSEGA